jgi:2-polyprenyl-3-methyl-5-hydroxy-6-metoxy-1,4-benzoquinol methylase
MNKATRIEIIDLTNPITVKETCKAYIDNRYSSYEFRSIRYEAVLDSLKTLGFRNRHSVLDVGGADGEFGRYLREQGHTGKYTVIDGLIDGTDLNNWEPQYPTDFVVSIEVIEHLRNPRLFLNRLDSAARIGVVLTTPNPHVTDVLAMDATHISEVYPKDFYAAGFQVYPQCLFFENGDSLVGVKSNRNSLTS